MRNWDRYDNLVKSAADRRHPASTSTSPAPARRGRTASRRRSNRSLRATWKPKPAAFKQFVQAVGRRYDGTYRDENGSRAALPARALLVAVERAQPGRLAVAAVGAPRWRDRPGLAGAVPQAAPVRLSSGLLASGHRADTDIILMGETAPLGSDVRSARAPMRPGFFLRELACIQPDGNAVLRSRPQRRATAATSPRAGR